ncbi:hypothetical protein PR048_016001 [Dryococelus australis]|uniref:Uncharacterized protein n=1 Tax=Dryococelus australis TaxID=614101 RepID=A0ABQ9HII2_9NEOP|nr:hypothetical protein PR048_016001 [Dryococelus australis]
MFKLCRFPQAWKKAKVITLPRPRKDPNYSSYVNKIIPGNQYGFRAYHGTIHPLIKIVEDITDGFNNKEQRHTIITLLYAEKLLTKSGYQD